MRNINSAPRTLLTLPTALFAGLLAMSSQAGSLVSQVAAPTLDTYDISQLNSPNSDTLNIGGAGKTYTGDNDAYTYVAGDRSTQGQLFTTGSALSSYSLNGIWVQHVNYTDNLNNGTWSGLNDGTSITLRIVDPSHANSASFVLSSQTCVVASGSGIPGGSGSDPYWSGTGKWLYMALDNPLTLAGNTQYGFDLTSVGPWFELAGLDADQYAGGSAYTLAGKGDLNTGTLHAGDRTFVVDLAAVPEPSTFALIGLGGAAWLARRKRS